MNAGVSSFEQNVAALNEAGTFTPSVPPPAVTLPRRQLRGTIEVSLGALRIPVSADASQTGLQIPNVGNFPGRIDVGYVFDRHGNFGVMLTARGPLSGVPQKVATTNLVDGDIQVEVSNATNISALNGYRAVRSVEPGCRALGWSVRLELRQRCIDLCRLGRIWLRPGIRHGGRLYPGHSPRQRLLPDPLSAEKMILGAGACYGETGS